MTPQHTRRLSKKLSLLLRHRPELYQLELDEQGWCEVGALLSAFRQKGEPLSREALIFFRLTLGIFITFVA